ncbi:MAG TPA: hypothetical protein VMS73_03410 [Anaerolineaceae bacterium]|nr:hypothetical protein [Anaerolineaceae bacterium]
MKKIRLFILLILLAGLVVSNPVEAAGIVVRESTLNSSHSLTLDLVCDGSVVCRIQNSSLDILNGNLIWFYQQVPAASGKIFASWISLELPDGTTRGFATYGLDGGYFSLGRNGEGSLVGFLAHGTIAPAVPGPMIGTFLFHANGTYISD